MMSEQKPVQSVFGPEITTQEVLAGQGLSGKVITGGHVGIGLDTTRALVGAGVNVIGGSRDFNKAQEVLAPLKNVELVRLDLTDPSSIDEFTAVFRSSNRALDLLIGNEGVKTNYETSI
ncbi:NADP-dependent 3-hydroxy acid dehydrogenase YdfG [Paenibacillus rhizosphaerae]|uniref:NADP-dependent 3-hydroxy acid dehydrogenase YdfG n=1 Tax=Paenibacillus rhizosphaerae TaxID=297318 RepID=A0A839TP53_9BACL|nr:SDR family NAD(P)-dependent oxidoreductase [Paenibacillus rhizosphaerae]MBB3128472.1 NADP-dependent 3-hydroxy acid dehydrogenase YdfG [Paenibacillus rhizosphaerae]